jgi:sugar O-acyltransferase (sialic acid O-acetyltransferase NeuD family)
MKNLVIYGAGFLDFIKLVEAINRKRKGFNILGFIDDSEELQGKQVKEYPVLGPKEVIPALLSKEDIRFFNNVNGSVNSRERVAANFRRYECKVASLIHPDVDLTLVEYGLGIMLPEGTVIGGNTKIGDYLTCRLSCVISHDVTIGSYVYIGPRVTICGHAVVEDYCYIGAGSTIVDKIKVGTGSVIGAGSTVIKDVNPRTLAYGVPAKNVKSIEGDPFKYLSRSSPE